MSDIAIKVESLSKCYQIYDQPRDRLKQFILPRAGRLLGLPPKQYCREFWALKDVSFAIDKVSVAYRILRDLRDYPEVNLEVKEVGGGVELIFRQLTATFPGEAQLKSELKAVVCPLFYVPEKLRC